MHRNDEEVARWRKKQDVLISFPIHVSNEIGRLLGDGSRRDIRGWNPSVDLYETEDAIVVEAGLPEVRSKKRRRYQ